ncbi:MAG: lysophospholipid acyltransferase family protein [Desulfonatronovibrionaceae bacterium]
MHLNPKITASILAPAVSAWSFTLRYQRHNFSEVLKLREEKAPMVYAIWHSEMFPLFWLHKGEDMTAVVSASEDGEILAWFMARMGYGLARGSSSRLGLRALKTAAAAMRRGSEIIFTVDGPTGPRHEVKPGAVYLAARFGAQIVPVRVHMPKKYVFKRSWDKFCLPYPFSRIYVRYGDPYTPSITEITVSALQTGCKELEERLKALL